MYQQAYLNSINFMDEPVAHRLQSLSCPRMKPVDGCTVNESREPTGPDTQGTANRRHTQYYLQAKIKKSEHVFYQVSI